LAKRLIEVSETADDGEPKTGRRFYYLALSRGYIRPDMSDSDTGKRSRNAAYKRVTDVLGGLRRNGGLPWRAVLDLTRELTEWQTFDSSRDARAYLRRIYSEDRWIGQYYRPLLIVEKDTMEPVCRPMAERWQIPFTSSRGYASLKLQHDVARNVQERYAATKQLARVYFISDLDPSGLDLQRAWEKAMNNFLAMCIFKRIALTQEQVDEHDLGAFALEVKPSDTRSKTYVPEHGPRAWEVDVLEPGVIGAAIDDDIREWLDDDAWQRREIEIDAARRLL